MKKILIIATVMILMLLLISCSNIKTVNTTQSDTETTSITPVVPSDTENDSIPPTLTVNNTSDTTEDYSHLIDESSIPGRGFRFMTIKDLHTYITTGSTNLSDYEEKPYSSFDYMEQYIPPKLVIKMGYKPLWEFFNYDVTKFEYQEAMYRMNDEEKIISLVYTLDDISVVIHLPSSEENGVTNVVEYYNKYYSGYNSNTITTGNTVDFQNASSSDYRYVLREVDGLQILFEVEDGVKKHAYVYIDGYLVYIVNSCSLDEGETSEAAHQKFMTEEKYASFAALFSDDEQAAKSAVSKFTE